MFKRFLKGPKTRNRTKGELIKPRWSAYRVAATINRLAVVVVDVVRANVIRFIDSAVRNGLVHS